MCHGNLGREELGCGGRDKYARAPPSVLLRSHHTSSSHLSTKRGTIIKRPTLPPPKPAYCSLTASTAFLVAAGYMEFVATPPHIFFGSCPSWETWKKMGPSRYRSRDWVFGCSLIPRPSLALAEPGASKMSKRSKGSPTMNSDNTRKSCSHL
jgi:hypothetical protein